MPYPSKFGQACWEKDRVQETIDTEAQVATDMSSTFLASHSPIKNIKDEKNGVEVDEETAFQTLFSQTGEVRGVVHGGPGTGKSHLIRWLSLRAEQAAKKKELRLNRYKIVLIQRNLGSLKAALEQLVEQLGDEFTQLTDTIRSSVDRLSDDTAREVLLSELALEVGPKWKERKKDPYSDDLDDLQTVINSPGVKDWLCRDGGVIARTIDRWNNRSTIEERENDRIEFSLEELPTDSCLTQRGDAKPVHELIDDIECIDGMAEKIVEILNSAFLDAQRELTGIKGSKLSDIFKEIRGELKKQDKDLLIFVEDLTVTGSLDKDMFQAFEPRKGPDLCRMVAVLGMTDAGWIPESAVSLNEKQRVNFLLDVGANATRWAQDPDEVAKFAARYLNTTRFDRNQIDTLAEERLSSDVDTSKCDECPHQIKCFKTFGYVELETKTKIGLFPFSKVALKNFLGSIKEDLRDSPRGLLDEVMEKALGQSFDKFAQQKFPSEDNFAVQQTSLTYWDDVRSTYLGGQEWNSNSHEKRAHFLTKFWFDANSAQEAAANLKLYREPFAFPKFTEEPIPVAPTKPIPPTGHTGTGETSPPRDDATLQSEIGKLDEWLGGAPLISDITFRNYLSDAITRSIRWQDYRGVPIQYPATLNWGRAHPIRVVGQDTTQAAQLYFLDFERDEETRNLIAAMARFQHLGNQSWNFRNGEQYKRYVYRWIRRNQKRVIESIQPDPPELRVQAIGAAVQMLAIAAIIRRRESLPKQDKAKRVGELFEEMWEPENRPKSLPGNLGRMIEHIENNWQKIKDFLISEIGVGMGTDSPKNYIDPLPILEALEKFEDKLAVQVPSEKINESYWKKRFGAVSKLSSYAELPQALEEQTAEIKDRVESIIEFLEECGYEPERLTDCVKEIIEIEESQKTNLHLGDPTFSELWSSQQLQDNKEAWGTNLNQARKVIADPKPINVICFDPEHLIQAWKDLTQTSREHLEKIEREIDLELNPMGREGQLPLGEGEAKTKDDLLQELEAITKILETPEE